MMLGDQTKDLFTGPRGSAPAFRAFRSGPTAQGCWFHERLLSVHLSSVFRRSVSPCAGAKPSTARRLVGTPGPCWRGLRSTPLSVVSAQRSARAQAGERFPFALTCFFIWLAVVGLLILGGVAHLYSHAPPKAGPSANTVLSAPPENAAGISPAVTSEQTDKRLAHLLQKPNNERQT